MDKDPLLIGRITLVSPDEVVAVLTTDEPSVEFLNRRLPVGQLGSYVKIPVDIGNLMGVVTKVGEASEGEAEASESAEKATLQFFHIQLLGHIAGDHFIRGVHQYPLVGNNVLLATSKEFDIIFGASTDEGGKPHEGFFSLGKFAMDDRYTVAINGKDFFARHSAVVGNTGAGKSCTIAQIIQECLKLKDSQIILFDLHGEYTAAFTDLDGQIDTNVLSVGDQDMVLPYWLFKYEELEELFLDKSNPMDIPAQTAFLKHAVMACKRLTANTLGLENVYTVDTPIYFSLTQLLRYANNLNRARFVKNTNRYAFRNPAYRLMTRVQQDDFLLNQKAEFNEGDVENEVDHPLYNSRLTGMIGLLEQRLNDRRFDYLLKPEEQISRSRTLAHLFQPESDPIEMSMVLPRLIEAFCGHVKPRRNLAIVDLSGVPFEVIDLTVSLISRLIFDFQYWNPHQQEHPIVMIYEEAHNYIPRAGTRQSYARVAVERIAKEGRKYGIGLVVVSQRPSELSTTVLAQCNNMIVMRLSNPEDQQYVTSVVSDQFAPLIGMLPILDRGEGFVLGEAVLMPTRIRVTLPKRLPRSSDVDVFKYWASGIPDMDVGIAVQHWWMQDRSHRYLSTETKKPDTKAIEEVSEPSLEPPELKTEPKPKPKEKTHLPDLAAAAALWESK